MTRTTTPEHTLELGSGMRLQYGAKGPPSRSAIVFVHGWPDSWRSFERVLDALSSDRYAVAVSLRGFGGSDAPAGGYSPDDFAADVIELIERLGIADAVIVGHSMGSLVAQRVACERPDLVRGLVLVGGFTYIDADLGAEVAGVLAELADPVDEAFVREFQAGTLVAPVEADFFEQIIAESMRAPLRVWRDAFDAVRLVDLRPELGRIVAPTLLLWGSGDALVARSQQDHLVAALPDARLVVYEGLGHSPNWEEPSRVAADIEAFVASIER